MVLLLNKLSPETLTLIYSLIRIQLENQQFIKNTNNNILPEYNNLLLSQILVEIHS